MKFRENISNCIYCYGVMEVLMDGQTLKILEDITEHPRHCKLLGHNVYGLGVGF